MDQDRRSLLLAAGASLLLLWLAAPLPPAALTAVLDAGTSDSPTGPLVAAVALLAWATAGWLALTALLTLAARLPGVVGRLGAALVRRVAPAAVRSAVEVALGVTVTVGLSAAPALADQPSVTAGQPGRAVDLDWPTQAEPVPAVPASPPAPRPAVVPSAPPAAPVVVVPGDTLWGIAERALERTSAAPATDAEIAAAWPRWWSGNREVLGDDPDLILPGTVLHPPGAGG